ncbi:MAG: hypoxanthine phosphoribosyltransferase [Dehalococcoidia bacterium]|nr:hypoxanthine phosphoribosyltransferase [Dehalococcoidia bacterium]
MNKKPSVLISREQLTQRVSELAAQIQQDYRHKNPLLVCVLKGGFIFMADLVRSLDMPVEIEFLRIFSYGSGTESSGKVEVVQGLKANIEGRDILVVEDIVDTGLSMCFVLDFLKQRSPASVKICALLDKPSKRRSEVCIDYLGFTVPDKFVVGYGLDIDEQYRYLPEVCCIEED